MPINTLHVLFGLRDIFDGVQDSFPAHRASLGLVALSAQLCATEQRLPQPTARPFHTDRFPTPHERHERALAPVRAQAELEAERRRAFEEVCADRDRLADELARRTVFEEAPN